MKNLFTICLLLVALTGFAYAQQQQVIIDKQGVTISTSEVEDFLLTIPAGDRELFAGNRQRIIEAIDSLVVNKVVYQDAVASGVTEQPEIQAKIERARQRIVIEAWLETYVQDQPDADYRAIAEEKFILNKDQYISPEMVDVKHILIAANQRTAGEARQQATQLLQQIKNNEISFDDAAKQHTEDPTYKDNNGLIAGVRRGATAPAFEVAAFGLNEQQPLSDVVDTQFGSHIIHWVAKNPARNLTFAEVEEQLIAEAKQEQRNRLVTTYLDNIRKQEVSVNQDVLNRFLDKHKLEQLGSAR